MSKLPIPDPNTLISCQRHSARERAISLFSAVTGIPKIKLCASEYLTKAVLANSHSRTYLGPN